MKTKIKKQPTTSAYERIRFYFNQYGAINNPEILRQGKLTDELEKKYIIFGKSITGNYDYGEKLAMTNKMYDDYLKPMKSSKKFILNKLKK